MLSQRFFILFLVMFVAIGASNGSAQVKTRDATVGVIGIRPLEGEDEIHLVDLSFNEPADAAPFQYIVHCTNCPLKAGRTYKAKISGSTYRVHQGERIDWVIQSIFVNGLELTTISGKLKKSEGESCGGYYGNDPIGPYHWVWNYWGTAGCVRGSDPIQWKPDTAPSQAVGRTKVDQKTLKNIPACHDYPAFHDIILKVVISVKPAPNHTWRSEQIPSLIAGQILNDLNDNKRKITFEEASGELPNFLLNVVMTETNEGTRQDTATVEVKGPPIWGNAGRQDEITLFSESSGDSSYINGTEAVYHLSLNLLKWFEGGWHTNPPCLQPDGSVRNQ